MDEALVPFGEVERCFSMRGSGGRTVQEVPVGAVAGSVGRAQKVDRCFARFAGPSPRSRCVGELTRQGGPLPPVQLFRVGPGDLVVDGGHRIAVARARRHEPVTSIVTEPDVAPAFGRYVRSEDGHVDRDLTLLVSIVIGAGPEARCGA